MRFNGAVRTNTPPPRQERGEPKNLALNRFDTLCPRIRLIARGLTKLAGCDAGWKWMELGGLHTVICSILLRPLIGLLSLSPSLSLSLSLSVRPSVRPSACLPGCLSVCLSVFLSRGSTLQGPGLELHSCILGVLGPVRVLDSVYSTGVFVVGV